MGTLRIGVVQSASSGCRTTVARTPEEIEGLRSEFARQPPTTLDSDLDYFMTVVHNRPAVTRPHVALIELPGGRKARVVGRIEERRQRFGVGRPLRVLQLSIGGVTGAQSDADCAAVVAALENTLADREADIVVLPQLEVGGALDRAAHSAPWWCVSHITRRLPHWSADLPDSFDAYMKARSPKTRANARYYRNRVLKEHRDVVVRRVEDFASVQELCAAIEAVAGETYQRGLGVGYTGSRLQLALIELAARRGWLRAWVLYIANAPAAYWLGYVYRGTFWSSANGFDTAYSHLRIGQFLQLQVTADLCAEPAIRSFDWGAGDAEYKRRFGDRSLEQRDNVLFAPSLRGAWLNAARTVRAIAAELARTWVSRTRLGARAKREWRSWAQRRARSRRPEVS